MKSDVQMPVANNLNRLTILPLPYEDICVDFVIDRVGAAPAGDSSQRVRLADRSYTVWEKGAKEQAPNTGLPAIDRDFNFASAYKDGASFVSQKSKLQFRIEGIGLMLHGVPYVQTGTDGLTSGKVTGEFGLGSDVAINDERHASYLMNLFMMQTFIRIGAGEEDDCTAIGGLTQFFPFGGGGLADNDWTPHFGNNIVGNERLFAAALINKSANKDGANPSLTIVRTDRADYKYHTATSTSDVQGLVLPNSTSTHIRQLITVVALGYTESLDADA